MEKKADLRKKNHHPNRLPDQGMEPIVERQEYVKSETYYFLLLQDNVDSVCIHKVSTYLCMALYLGHGKNIYIPDMLFPLDNMTILKRLVLRMQGHLSILLTLVIYIVFS